MDTHRIYEQFREPFGEPASRALAETLGHMFEELRDTVTTEDFRILRGSLDADVSRLDSCLSRLADAQGRTEATVADLVVGQRQLFEAQARTEASIAHLDATVSKLTGAQTVMATALQRLPIRTDDIVRADERAKLLRRAGLAAIPLVACNSISPESTAFAKLRQVRIWLDGSLVSGSGT